MAGTCSITIHRQSGISSASIKRGTTWPIELTLPDVDLTGASWVIVSVKPETGDVMELTDDALEVAYESGVSTVRASLTQAQSLALTPGTVQIDLNWMLDGLRGGAKPRTLTVTDTLLDREVPGTEAADGEAQP